MKPKESPVRLVAAALLPLLTAGCAGTSTAPEAVGAAGEPRLAVTVKFKSRYDADEIRRRYPRRMHHFRALPGLVQKYYLHDAEADEWAGIYLWDSAEAMQDYLSSDLRASIPEAYGVVGTPRVESFEVIDVLRASAPVGRKEGPTPQPEDQLAQHAWLHQLVGEWEATSEAAAEPGGEPTTWTFRESTHSLGGLWIVTEGSAEYEGQPFRSRMTLGYDPNRGEFVGTWVDTIQTTMWTYVGQLDAEQHVLTLEAEGPAFDDPQQTTRYRDQIELVGPGHKRMISSAQAPDGSWTVFMTMEALRVE
jgi:heme-degrading monooxygenase HmoA